MVGRWRTIQPSRGQKRNCTYCICIIDQTTSGYLRIYTTWLGDHLGSTAVKYSFNRLASRQYGRLTPPSSVYASRDSTVTASDVTLQKGNFRWVPLPRPSPRQHIADDDGAFKYRAVCLKEYI